MASRRIPMRPGAPEQRPPAPFTTPARPGTCATIGAVCGGCTKIRSSREFGHRVHRCGEAIAEARRLGRRLPNPIGPTLPACSQYRPSRRRR